MSSLWQMTSPGIKVDPFEAGRYDTVVVGAGLTGLTTAVLLARAGQRVTVLEATAAGAVTTGNTTGKLSLLQGTVFSEIREHCGDEALLAYAEANREGQAWLLRQLSSWGVEVQRRTAVTYTAGAEKREALDREADAVRSAGLPVEETQAAELPFGIAGAIAMPDQAQLHPLVVLAELARELRERGGSLVERCRVTEIEHRGELLEIVSDCGTVVADRCVLATGVPILDRGLFFAKLEPNRSFAAAYRLPREAPQGMYVAVDSPHSLRTAEDAVGNEVLVVGGGAHTTGRSPDTARELERFDAWAAEHFSAEHRLAWWGAQDYRSHSRLPFAGPLPRGRDRIFAATGYNKWGMTNGVAAALTLAADILGGDLGWARALREHATRLPTVKDAVGVNADVAAHAVSGWVGAGLRSGASAEDLESLEEGDGIVTRVGAAPVGTARVDGRLCRVSAICPHLGGVLAWNRAERSWDCPLHGSRFSADGIRLEGPAVDDLGDPAESSSEDPNP